MISDTIRQRLSEAKAEFGANSNISEFIREGELDLLRSEVEQKVEALLRSLVIDIDNDHNSKDTPKRLAKMYLDEVLRGRYVEKPSTTEFPNARKLDQLYVVGPIAINSMCSHHFAPILGKCWIGVYPGTNVIGLSKFNRLIDWIMSRGQIQEEATIDIADCLEESIKPEGLAVYMKARHLCMCWRGVKDSETEMITSVMRGKFRDVALLKDEFLAMVKS